MVIREGRVTCAACGGVPALGGGVEPSPTVYTQRDGERPPGCGRVRYLRIWRAAAAAGDLGAAEDGRARLLTVEAYQRHAGRRTRPPKAPSSSPRATDPDAEALMALGLERAGRRSA